MTDDELKALVTEYGFDALGDFDRAFHMAKEIERRTRQAYFRIIQVANNAASSRELTAGELDKFVFNRSK